MKFPGIVAHRGVSSLYPENSLIAFEKAAELKADGIECDVRRTSDGRVVVMHDATIDRTTTGVGYVCMMTLEEIRRFNLKDASGRVWEDQAIPTFDELLELMKSNDLLMRIEMKEVGLEKQVVEKLKSVGLTERATLTSFLPMAIKTVKSIDRSIKTALITERFAQAEYEHIRPDIDAVDFCFGPALDRQMYDRARDDGLILDLWTIDDVDTFRKALEWEPDFVTTNYPQIMLEQKDK